LNHVDDAHIAFAGRRLQAWIWLCRTQVVAWMLVLFVAEAVVWSRIWRAGRQGERTGLSKKKKGGDDTRAGAKRPESYNNVLPRETLFPLVSDFGK
jgi:hypothetical protein